MPKTVQINSTKNSIIDQLYNFAEDNDAKLHLKINQILEKDELFQLEEFVAKQKPFPFAKISLYADLNALKNPQFLANLKQLNNTQVSAVELIFSHEEVKLCNQEIIDTLTNKVASHVAYPLQILESSSQGIIPSKMSLEGFQDIVIANIQKRNKGQKESLPLDQEVKKRRNAAVSTDPMSKKIRLKELIKRKKVQDEQLSQYIPLEVQHVEQVEQEIALQHEEVIEIQQNLEAQEIQEYNGQLLGFQEFSAPIYKQKVVDRTGDVKLTDSLYILLQQELFANLPHAIKYVSPDAAEQLALNLSQLVTLNKDNLPNGFLLKQTALGEIVLDYDAFLENEQANSFTPVESDIEYKPIYNVELKEQDVRHWMGNDGLFTILCPNNPYTTPKQLINLWIKYGDEGVTSFFNAFKTATHAQPLLAGFLLENYLTHLPQWDHLYNNQAFSVCLERISRLDEQKLMCLQKFLQNTGSSHHDLSKTIAAFEVFWNEVNLLCAEQNVPIAGINSASWSTPTGGNPLIYMERMLFLLKNARSLDDQFKLLNGVCLDNYGAYYASRFEGFKTVSAEMELHYDPEKLNNQSFNKNFNLYKIELESLSEPFAQSQKYREYVKYARFFQRGDETENIFWLVDNSKELLQPLDLEQLKKAGHVIPFNKKAFVPPYQFYISKSDGSMKLLFSEPPIIINKEEFYAFCFRFIGMQNSGITVSSLAKQLAEYKSDFFGSDVDLSGTLLATMFFVSHERFIESQPLKPIWDTFDRASIHQEVIIDSIKLLNKLYQRDIKLNQSEGLMLFQSISGMNSAEFEGLHISKKECIEKLLTQLEQNKFATFKFFDFRTKKSSPKWPFLYALDTAEFLAKDPVIAATYHDDLLLFSGLINSITQEAYFHARFADPAMKETPAAKTVMNNLDKVTQYLQQAATQEQPNNLHYAIQVMIHAKEYVKYSQFINACTEIAVLPSFDGNKVDEILRQHQFKVSAELPEIFTKDNADLKGIMILLIIQLEAIKNNVPQKQETPIAQNTQKSSEEDEEIESTTLSRHADLASLSIAELQVTLQKSWEEGGVLLSVAGKIFLNRILKTTKELAIKSAFGMPDAKGLLKVIGERIDNVPDFQDYSDFAKVNKISNEAEKIADLFKQILKNSYVVEHEQEFIALFSQVDFSKIDYETLYNVLSLLNAMPQRNYLSLLHTIFSDVRFTGKKERVVELLNHLSTLNNNYFPSEYLDAFSKLVIANPGEKEAHLIVNQMIAIYAKDNKDPLLELIMTHPELTYKQVTQILNLSKGIENNRDKVSEFFIHLVQTQKLELSLKQLIESPETKQKKILEILSKGHVLNRKDTTNKAAVDYMELASFLISLSADELELLSTFYETTPVSTECLLNAFKNPERPKNFQSFLLEFEKAPFGKRDLEQQFSVSEIGRVINQAKDLLNDSVYTYQYRKQLMEAFLFVNAIGDNLPVYYNKPAKELTNAEIRSYFSDLKAKSIPGLTPFQNRLLALGLMREAMYRSTGEFPYSTQVIALIDGMMHPGDFISNIDTGQGKSQIDTMKAALLWLDSDRVDLTTSSLVDAKRDIANYGPFLKLLNIPYSGTPISSSSPKETFQKNGINFSTFAQLSLFFAKAKVTGEVLETPDTVVSAVVNESDYTILDNRIIYRFATADGSAVRYGQEWIYNGINEFVSRPEFIENDKTSAADDIADLKSYLKIKAGELRKSGKIVNKFSDAQYLSWLESALTVNYILKENEDYVIPDEFEKKVINGNEIRSKVVKVLLKDHKVSPDSTFGNGIQQLLYAHLNKERGCTDFVIEPQNKTIISTNNKNLIDYYRGLKGFIWGSSGTVGSRAEILEQYRKYGFEFAKSEPHQPNRVQFNEPIVEADEKAQFDKLISQVTATNWFADLISLFTGKNPDENRAPSIVFCKDINTAKRLFKELEKNNPRKLPIQLYTGVGKEEDFINNASKPGMITITTSALGRNTDIPYDKIAGLRVWHTFIGSTRDTGQKSGRTGRQGSAGEINYVLNAQELGSKTIEQIREDIDQQAALERSISEELYNVLGYLLLQIDKIQDEQFIKGKTAFLRESWSQFSYESENQFRECRLDAGYYKKVFMEQILASYNQMIETAVKAPVAKITTNALQKAIEQKHLVKPKYNPYKGEIKITDCVPPVEIAYHLLQFSTKEEQPEAVKEGVKDKLKQLFENMTPGNFVAENSDYLRYLLSKPTTQEVIVEAHKEFITQFLRDNSQKLNFFQRWFGFEGKLNQVASTPNYLLMFHAFASMPNQPIVEFEVIQEAVNSLLDEYLETSWFISEERKEWATIIKKQINAAKDVDELIHCLSKAQVEIAKRDITENKGRFFKPLHYFGHSRYQTTLNRALNLTSSLSGKTDVDTSTNDLVPLLTDVTDNTPITEVTLDELKHKANSEKRDKGNASVIIESLENTMSIKNRMGPEGMIGRNGIFNSATEDKSSEEKITNPTSSKKNNPI